MSPVWAGGQVPCLLVRRRVDGAGQPRAAPQACASRWPAQLSGTRTVRSFFCELNFNLGCLDFMGCPSRLPQILATLCVCVLEAPRWPPAALRLRREQGWRSHRLGPGNAVWDLPSADAE